MATRYTLHGKVCGLFLGLISGSAIATRQAQVEALFEGFKGDKHSGITHKSNGHVSGYPRGTEIRNNRQIMIVSVEELGMIAAKMGLPEIKAEWVGANLLIEGIPHLTQLPPGTRLCFAGGAVITVHAEDMPCKTAGRAIQEQYDRPDLAELFPKAAAHLRGVTAWVERPGTIHEGEEVRVETPVQVIYDPEQGELS